jgi:hypothetical protein
MAHPVSSPLHAIVSPMDRLASASPEIQVGAMLIAAIQWVARDLFAGALMLVIFAGVSDYLLGGRIARMKGEWNGNAARNGVVGKMSGVFLCLLIRFFEAWLAQQADLNTHGAVATGLAVSLFAVEVQSIAFHRESVGARPIPILSSILDWMQRMAGNKIPGGPKA